MTADGFEFSIRPPMDATAYGQYDDEYVVNATLGYGITSFLGRGPIAIGTVPIDPNEQYLSSLDDASQITWYAAFDECGLETGYLSSPETQEREEEVYGELAALLLEEIEQRISAEPDVVDAWGVWRRCMADAGYDYTDRFAIHQELSAERDRLLADFGPELLTGQVVLDDLPDEIAQQIADLQTRERMIAQADLGCRPGLDEAIYEARVTVEQAILDVDHERVDRLLLALAELPAQY
jgi:hypothetical protein